MGSPLFQMSLDFVVIAVSTMLLLLTGGAMHKESTCLPPVLFFTLKMLITAIYLGCSDVQGVYVTKQLLLVRIGTDVAIFIALLVLAAVGRFEWIALGVFLVI